MVHSHFASRTPSHLYLVPANFQPHCSLHFAIVTLRQQPRCGWISSPRTLNRFACPFFVSKILSPLGRSRHAIRTASFEVDSNIRHRPRWKYVPLNSKPRHSPLVQINKTVVAGHLSLLTPIYFDRRRIATSTLSPLDRRPHSLQVASIAVDTKQQSCHCRALVPAHSGLLLSPVLCNNEFVTSGHTSCIL